MSPAEMVELALPKNTSLSSAYIDYYPGDLNVILIAPHGGRIKPSSIPDRDAGAIVNGKIVYDHSASLRKDYDKLKVRTISDSNTIQLTLMVATELHKVTGRWPSVVVNQLYRGKMDANCDLEKASFNVPEAQEAWRSFHRCINDAKERIKGRGLLLDIHGQSHEEGWVELGYTVPGKTLDSGDFDLSSTSISNLASWLKTNNQLNRHELISGQASLGAFLEDEKYSTVPSPTNPSPKGKSYYTGGYNTLTHGSKHGGQIDAIQVECPSYVREIGTLPKFSRSLAWAIKRFWSEYYAE